MDKKADIDKLICQAKRGRSFWISQNIGVNEYVLLLPDQETRINELCREAFSDMLREKKLQGRIYSVVDQTIEREDAEAVIRLYSLYRFTDKLIIGSLYRPYGRNIANLTALEGMDLKKAIRAVLFMTKENV